MHDVPPRGVGMTYAPGPLEDKARHRIACLLIAVVGTHDRRTAGRSRIRRDPGSEIEESDVILGALVAQVSAATGFYYGTKG